MVRKLSSVKDIKEFYNKYHNIYWEQDMTLDIYTNHNYDNKASLSSLSIIQIDYYEYDTLDDIAYDKWNNSKTLFTFASSIIYKFKLKDLAYYIPGYIIGEYNFKDSGHNAKLSSYNKSLVDYNSRYFTFNLHK